MRSWQLSNLFSAPCGFADQKKWIRKFEIRKSEISDLPIHVAAFAKPQADEKIDYGSSNLSGFSIVNRSTTSAPTSSIARFNPANRTGMDALL